MNRRRALVSLGLAACVAGGVASLAGCPSTTTSTLYTPVTGFVIDSQSLVQGFGCGTEPTQVYRYAAVVYATVDGAPTTPLASGVFDCFGPAQFANLPTPDGGTTSYFVQIYAWNYASFPGSVPSEAAADAGVEDAAADGAGDGASAGDAADAADALVDAAADGQGAETGAADASDASPADAASDAPGDSAPSDAIADALSDAVADADAAPVVEAGPSPPPPVLLGPCTYYPVDAACPGENPTVVAMYAPTATWTTTCTAAQLPGTSEIAVCQPLVANASASDAGTDAAADAPFTADAATAALEVATQGFALAEGGALQCQSGYDGVSATYTFGDASGFVDAVACPSPVVIPAVPGASYAIEATLVGGDAGKVVARAECAAVAPEAGATALATCAPAIPKPKK